jgi:serine/threonine protein kinase
MLVLELVPGGELFPYLELGPFPATVARAYFKQLAEAMEHSHAHGIAHRDLKPENLLLDSDFVLKVTDFGLCKISDNFTDEIMRTRCGTTTYMAPEVLAGRGYKGQAYDVWSMGILLFIFVFGQPPLEKANETCWWYKQLSTGNSARFWAQHQKFNEANKAAFTADIMELITGMLKPNPDERWTIAQIKNSAWYNGPSESTSTLKGELTRRKVQIDRAKNAKRMAEKAAAGRVDGGFDPFARATVRAAEEDGPLAPKIPSGGFFGNRLNDIYSDKAAVTIGSRLTSTLKDIGAAVVPEEGTPYLYNAEMFPASGPTLKFSLQIFDASTAAGVEEGSCNLLKIDRRGGELTAFRDVMRMFNEKLADIIVPDPASEAV